MSTASDSENGNRYQSGRGMGDEYGSWVAQSAVATADALAGTFKRMARLPFLYQRAQQVRKGATPSEIVYEQDRYFFAWHSARTYI